MMGSAKLTTIRAQVRDSFKKTDAELVAWFNRQIEDREQKPRATQCQIDTLRLLRDALKQEVKRAKPKPKRRRTSISR